MPCPKLIPVRTPYTPWERRWDLTPPLLTQGNYLTPLRAHLECCMLNCLHDIANPLSSPEDVLSSHVCVQLLQLCSTLCNTMDCSCQTPLSTEFSRPEYWSGLPFPSPGDLPDPGMEPRSPALQPDSLHTPLIAKWDATCLCSEIPTHSVCRRALSHPAEPQADVPKFLRNGMLWWKKKVLDVVN